MLHRVTLAWLGASLFFKELCHTHLVIIWIDFIKVSKKNIICLGFRQDTYYMLNFFVKLGNYTRCKGILKYERVPMVTSLIGYQINVSYDFRRRNALLFKPRFDCKQCEAGSIQLIFG